jgi:hypothetical protein
MLQIAADTIIRLLSPARATFTNASFHVIKRADFNSKQNITMADGYDSVEKKFGISAYASPHVGFAAVVKARYSDFIVHEGE